MQGGYFSEWLNRYGYYLRMRNYSPRTITSYEQVVKQFAYYLWLRRNSNPDKLENLWKDYANARLDTDVEVEPVMLTDFLTFMNSVRNYKPKTLHRMISTLTSFYRFLYTQGALASNPMFGIERPRIKEQETPVPETQPGAQVDRLDPGCKRKIDCPDNLRDRSQDIRTLQYEYRGY